MGGYYRVRLGEGGRYVEACLTGSFIGTDYSIDQDLTGKLPDKWQDFNREFIPIWLAQHPMRTKIGAGLSMAGLHVVSKGIAEGDIVLCPNKDGNLLACEVVGPYYYVPGDVLSHRRPVRWLNIVIERDDLSQALAITVKSRNTWARLNEHQKEIEELIGSQPTSQIISMDAEIEDPTVFALEKHLEEFLITNWENTELGKSYDIFQDEDGTGQQYPTDTGPIDILAVSKDKRNLLVIELKKGRASDVAIGQIQRYMGFVIDELAAEGQTVSGIIIALDDDRRIRRALRATRNIDFYRYELKFTLTKETI